MPRVTVYIRNDDYEKWKLIENKSELISEAINRSVITSGKDDNYLEHHILPPSEGELGGIFSTTQPKVAHHVPSKADGIRMLKELDYRIDVLAESQDPEDQERAKELFAEKLELQKAIEATHLLQDKLKKVNNV